MRDLPTLVAYAPEWQDELIQLWRESFEFGVGIRDPHPLSEQARYFNTSVLPENSVQLAVSRGQLQGFVAASPESVSQLYVRVGCHRQGVGSLLLDRAKSQSKGSLRLYTFARNHVARRFYERHGFVVVGHGFEPHWQLEDIQYAWSADARDSA